MNRRSFLRSIFGGVLGGGALWATMRQTAAARFAASFLDLGDKDVENSQSVPPFEARSYRDIPSLKFLIIGDWGAGGSLQRNIAAQMLVKANTEQPQFILSTGDNIYPNGVNSADDIQWKKKFEDVYTGKALELPWYAVLGNHDYRLNPEAQVEYSKKNPRWNMPARYYHVTQEIPGAGRAEFFMLDTQAIMKNAVERKTQAEWLEAKLAASDARWKIVTGHHMIRSHGAYGDQDFMIRSVKPLLDSYAVDMYICGHDHDLQYLKCGDDKFRCLISGAGGGARKTAYGPNTVFAATNGGFAYMALTGTELHLQFVNREGKILFADTITKT